MCSRLGLPCNSFRNRFLGALESRSRWRLARKLFKNSALALEFAAIYSGAALPTFRHPGVALTLRTPSGMVSESGPRCPSWPRCSPSWPLALFPWPRCSPSWPPRCPSWSPLQPFVAPDHAL
eukprot:5817120-Pyramimonas_sp.AAC.1